MIALSCGDDGSGGATVRRDAGGATDDAALDAPICGEPMPASCAPTAAPTTPTTPSGGPQCSPLTQMGCAVGEKCTWIQDAAGIGHIGCAPAGQVAAGCACTRGAYGPTGYDDCAAGAYCHQNLCRPICDQRGGTPQCDAIHACVVYDNVFDLGDTTPAAAGVCMRGCDPLDDNDFLGSGTRPGCACAADHGCYGTPSNGTAPSTAFSCVRELSQTLVHRSPAPMPVFQNSCAQGYIPLLFEQTGSTTIVCVAFCKPLNCYAGNCGANDENRLGAAPHRCNNTDRRGTLDTAAGGEHCQFLWFREIDNSTRTYLPSPYSDSLGICFDHSKYLYDSDGDNVRDAPYPPCAQLQDGMGTGSNPADPLTYFGAATLGCVDSTRLPMMATGKHRFAPARMPLLDARVPFAH